MLRGGSWNNKPNNVRSANRNRNNTDNRNNNNGFRLAQAALVRMIIFTDVVRVQGGVHEVMS